MNSLPTTVRIREEGPRDGWQNIDEPFIPTQVKLQLIERLLDSGLQHISVTSMASARWVPQLADADVLLAQLRRRPDVRYEVLVPNQRGLDRLLPLVTAGAPVDDYGATGALDVESVELRPSKDTDEAGVGISIIDVRGRQPAERSG